MVGGVFGPSSVARPPLSLVKTMSVFPASPRSATLATIRPTLSSRLSSIAAYTGFSWRPCGVPSHPGYFAINSSFAFIGMWTA